MTPGAETLKASLCEGSLPISDWLGPAGSVPDWINGDTLQRWWRSGNLGREFSSGDENSYFGVLWFERQPREYCGKVSVVVTTVLGTGVTTYVPKADDSNPGSPLILLQEQ
jgi:hypothetical protein